MNMERRAQIEKIKQDLAAIQERIEAVAGAEREAFDNLTEGLQATSRGQAMEAAADTLDTAYDQIEDCLTSLDEAME